MGRKERIRQRGQRQSEGRRGEGAAWRRDGAEKGRKMRGELNWQHGEGRESIYKTI